MSTIHDIDEKLVELLETTETLGKAKGKLATLETVYGILETLFDNYIHDKDTTSASAIAVAQKAIRASNGY